MRILLGLVALPSPVEFPIFAKSAQVVSPPGPLVQLATRPTNATSEQTAVIQKMLRDHDRATSSTNVSLALFQIIAYCNIYDGKAGSNSNQRIDNIAGLR